MIDIPFLITAYVTMLVVIDPLGTGPIFVALTQGMSARARRMIALRACGVGFGVLALFTIFGEAVLGFAGISMPAFQIAGGILLFLTALDMLFKRRTKRREDHAQEAEADDPSVFPLGIPLIAGPGAIATVILLSNQKPGVTGIVLTLGVTFAVLIMALALFYAAGFLERLLGRTGIDVVTRLLGMLLAALSVQFVLDGVTEYGFLH